MIKHDHAGQPGLKTHVFRDTVLRQLSELAHRYGSVQRVGEYLRKSRHTAIHRSQPQTRLNAGRGVERDAKHPSKTPLTSRAIGQIVALSFFINVLMLASPLYMLQIYDRVVSSGSIDTLLFLSLACGGLLLAMGLLEGFRAQLASNYAGIYQGEWAPLLLGALARKSSIGNGQTSRQPLDDLDAVQKFMSGNILLAFLDAPWTPLFLIALFLLHPLLGLVALFAAVLLSGLALVSERMTRKLYIGSLQSSAKSARLADAILGTGDAVRSMGMLGALRARWSDAFTQSTEQQGRANDRAAFMRGLAQFLRPLMQMAILGFGAYLVIQGALSAGAMIAGSILMGRALAPVEQVVANWRTILQARSAHARLQKFMSEDYSPQARMMEHPTPAGHLSAQEVSVFVPGTDKPILHKISLDLRAGEALAIVGPSGAGKSTLARLLAGSLHGDEGAVRLDGVELSHWCEAQRSQNLGFLPQDVQLCEGTIAQNIARFQTDCDEAIHTAAQAAGVSDLVNHLPDGFMTEITSAGAPLSPGQRQRVALARALYGDPPLLVLDEPNAHLDSAGESALVQAIANARKRGATVVVITHRASLLHQMDKVLTLVAGRVQYFGDKSGFLNKLSAAA